MAKKKNQKTKIRTIIQRESYDDEKLEREIRDLESKKANLPKGFKGFVQKASINAAINDRKRLINNRRAITKVKVQTELEEARGRLNALRKKNAITLDSLYGNTDKKDKGVDFGSMF